VKPNLMTVMTVSLGVLFVGATAAFLLYVPALTIATVSAIVLALVVTFGLGVQAGTKGIRLRLHKPPAFKKTVTPLRPNNARLPLIVAISDPSSVTLPTTMMQSVGSFTASRSNER
jgi:hypothetical protein